MFVESWAIGATEGDACQLLQGHDHQCDGSAAPIGRVEKSLPRCLFLHVVGVLQGNDLQLTTAVFNVLFRSKYLQGLEGIGSPVL